LFVNANVIGAGIARLVQLACNRPEPVRISFSGVRLVVDAERISMPSFIWPRIDGRESVMPPRKTTKPEPDPAPVGDFRRALTGKKFATVLADPPWQFVNRTGKVAPEHRRLSRYGTLTLPEICALPVHEVAAPISHLYLWCPNAMLPEGLSVMAAWGFTYKSNIVWYKVRKDDGPDGRGVGFYFRNVTELLLFGIRGKGPAARTLPPGRSQVNLVATRKREHSRKPDEIYPVIESCSSGPRLEMFARGVRPGWIVWGNEAADDYEPSWDTYAHNSASERRAARPVEVSGAD
jgi:N6-adenosine-specific RNA methylase IME4